MRVALYSRVSTEEQALHGLSIDAQKAALDEWAAPYVVVDHYTDLGVSARKPISKRPELQRLLRDVEQGKIDLIVFTKLDRWTRNVREYYKAEDVLEAHNVAWKAIHEDYETETAAGRLKVGIMLAVAQDEADRTGERIKAVFADKRRKGLAPTGSVPLGIKLVDGKDAPSENADAVRAIFDSYIAQRSTRAVAKQTGRTANGIKWIITNRRYLDAGVIDPQTWETAQAIAAQRSQRHVRSDRVFLFSGLLFCKCGSRLASAAVPSRGRVYYYYRCNAKNQGRPCPGTYISEPTVEAFLLENTVKKVEDVNLRIRAEQGTKPNPEKLRARLDRLTDLHLADLITREKYEAEFRSLQAQISEAEKQPRVVDPVEVKTTLEAYNGLSRQAKKAFWSRLVSRVDIDGDSIDFSLIWI